MNNLKLYRVNVTQEWSAEAEIFVMATSQVVAEEVAYKNVDLNSYDSDIGSKAVRAIESSYETLDKLDDDNYFFAPNITGQYCNVDYETFKSYITPEDLERQRIEKIEANNGQLPLPLEQ
jgi:hypothetical protein